MSTLDACYQTLDWNETTTVDGRDGAMLTRVDAASRYEGTLNGETAVRYQMFYQTGTTGFYEGFELFSGTYQETQASVWFRHHGSFDEAGVNARIETVPGTGTGSLAGKQLRFETRFEGEGPYPITIAED